MSHTDLLGYNFRVVNLNQVIRGILITVSIILLLTLMVSSDWTAFTRLLHKSQAALDSGDVLTAAIKLAQAANYSPEPYDLMEDAGILSMEAGDFSAAKTLLTRVSDSNTLSPAGLIVLGDIARREGNLEQSILYWEQANAGREDTETYIKLVQAYQQSGEWEEAIRSQRQLVVLNPNNPDFNYRLGLMLAATDPDSAPAYLSLAGDLDEVIRSKANALSRNLRSAANRDDPSYPFTIAGQELAALGEWDLAMLALRKAVQLNPGSADSWAYLGEALQQTGNKGYEALKKAAQLNPDSVAANTLMALYWQRQERYDLSLVYLYAAAGLDENNPALQAEIGNTLGLMGNIPAAEAHYQKATSMNPNDPTYWNSLANYYIRYDIDIKEKGAAAARQAVILAPQDPVSLDILAQVYLLQENWLLAERFLDRALAADVEYAPAHLHAGLISIMNRNRLEAYQHFSAALTNSQPGSQTYDQARRLLDTYFP